MLRVVWQILIVLLVCGAALLLFSWGGLVPLVLVAIILFIDGAGRRRQRQAMLLWHLALAVQHDRSLPDELQALADRGPGKWRERLRLLANDLQRGVPLSAALEGRRGLVPRAAVTRIRIGEECDRLGDALTESAVRSTSTRSYAVPGVGSLAGLLTYLVIVVNVAELIVGFLLYYIVPKFKKIFEGFDTSLPALTEDLIAVGDAYVEYYYLLTPVMILPQLVLIGLGVGYWYGWGEFDLYFLTRHLTRLDAPNVLRDLARAVETGRPLRGAVESIAHTHRRLNVRRRLRRLLDETDAGRDFWASLGGRGFVTAAEVTLLQSAERVGNLPWTLRELADAAERRRAYRLATFAQFAEPVVVLGLGAFVLFVCAAFFLPLVKLLNDLS